MLEYVDILPDYYHSLLKKEFGNGSPWACFNTMVASGPETEAGKAWVDLELVV
jgi:hypothetical protein